MLKDKLKVTAVSFANALPLVYGITHAPDRPDIELSLDVPSISARKLKDGTCELGLIPIGALPEMQYYEILPGYCVGAEGKVRTVRLFSDVPLHNIKHILLDQHSRTSVILVKILAKYFWKINPGWVHAGLNYEKSDITGDIAGIAIGDKVFGLEGKYKYGFDLAEEWIKFAGLPFVFAAWVANRSIEPEFVKKFNSSLKYGVDHLQECLEDYPDKSLIESADLNSYLRENISFRLDSAKIRGMHVFLRMAKEF
jgi:chorismate dehydratase